MSVLPFFLSFLEVTMNTSNCIAGLWKFGIGITHGELIEVVKSFIFDTDGSRYRRIDIRLYSPTKYAIDFCYALGDTSVKVFVHRVSDKLRRQFGNDLVGWDIGLIGWSYGDHWNSLADQLRDFMAQVTDARLDELYQKLYRQGWAEPRPMPLSTRNADSEIRHLVIQTVSIEQIERREGRIPKVE